MNNKPIVMISSYPPRLCGICTFCEEACEFIRREQGRLSLRLGDRSR